MDKPTTPHRDSGKWTPEIIIQAGKELVTALLGMMIVLYTLWLSIAALGFAGDTTRMASAKDVLMLILGLAGGVIGYYFGRVPADARAAQATKEAAQATTDVQEVKAGAASAADQMDDMLTRGNNGVAGSAARGSGQQDGAAMSDEIRRIRDSLRSLSRT